MAMDHRGTFLKIYANLPLPIREEIILITDDKLPITWNVAYIEVVNNTPLSKNILKKLKKFEII